jgi:hypothetical protein
MSIRCVIQSPKDLSKNLCGTFDGTRSDALCDFSAMASVILATESVVLVSNK